MADQFAMSFGVLNYSGMLFNKGNTRTPLSSIIGGRAKTTNHVEFVTGQEFTSGGGAQPAISESASLTAPDATVVTRAQKTNVTQIDQNLAGHDEVPIALVNFHGGTVVLAFEGQLSTNENMNPSPASGLFRVGLTMTDNVCRQRV